MALVVCISTVSASLDSSLTFSRKVRGVCKNVELEIGSAGVRTGNDAYGIDERCEDKNNDDEEATVLEEADGVRAMGVMDDTD